VTLLSWTAVTRCDPDCDGTRTCHGQGHDLLMTSLRRYSPARPAHLLICCLLAVGARRCWRVSRVCRFNGRSLKAVTVRHRCRKQTSFDRTTKRPRNSFAVRTYGRSEADRWSHSSRRVGCFTVLCAVWTVATRYGLGITRQVFRHGKLCR